MFEASFLQIYTQNFYIFAAQKVDIFKLLRKHIAAAPAKAGAAALSLR